MNTIQHALIATRDALASTDVPPHDTQERALWRMRFVLQAFYDGDHNEPATAVKDLLTDLLHYCDAEGVSLEQTLGGAMFMVREERHDWGLTPATTPPAPAPAESDADDLVRVLWTTTSETRYGAYVSAAEWRQADDDERDTLLSDLEDDRRIDNVDVIERDYEFPDTDPYDQEDDDVDD